MDITRATIPEGNFDDKLWPEIIFTMTYIKNNFPIKALASNTILYKAPSQENTTDVSYFCVLDSTIYVFFHKKERSRKSKKWATKVLKIALMGYDGHTIHRLHIKEQN